MIVVRAILASLLAAGALTACAATPVEPPAPCASGLTAGVQFDLYFGTDIRGGGHVDEAAWTAFLDKEVTPRFPEGLTVVDSQGRYRAQDGTPTEESSKVLTILALEPEAAVARLDEVREAYKARFDQESVLLTESQVCYAF